MIKKHIAYDEEYQIDIHGGGADLFFPHHENEEAQSHCAYDNHLAKYWMHNGFVNINGEKMSKSLGNSFFVKDALKIYDGEILRYYLMQTHYRDGFNFSEEDLLVSKKRLDKIYRLKKRVYGITKFNQDKEFEAKLLEAMNDDLNISKALAVIDEFISNANENLDKNPKDKALKQKINSNIKYVSELLGVGKKDAYQYFQIGVDEKTKEKIESLIKKRNEAKKEKNYEKADKIRDEILNLGVQIQDTQNGTLWEKA
jgi:cysteinyl-tRNA synthetase